MIDDNVVDFRPRDQVSRKVEVYRSQPPEARTAFCASAPMRIDGAVSLVRLARGLASEGFCIRQDKRTEEFVLMPILLARQEEEAADD